MKSLYIPVIDISKWQGNVDFSKFVANGVQGVIIRAGNGIKADPFVGQNVSNARAHGLALGVYWFANPKASRSGYDQGKLLGEAHKRYGGEIPPMLDVESYASEPSNGFPALTGQPYAEWLKEMRRGCRETSEDPFMYTNAAYWNPNVGSAEFADMDLLVARYPFYSPVQCAANVPPLDAQDWDDWIFSTTSKRPIYPTGWDTWDGWQFSAGYNGRGPAYGAQSSDLDLNIIKPDVWLKWLGVSPAPPPPPRPGEEAMPLVQLIEDTRSVWATDWVTANKISQARINILKLLKQCVLKDDGEPLIVPVPNGVVDEILDRTQTRYPPVVVPAPVIPNGTVKVEITSVPGQANGTVTYS